MAEMRDVVNVLRGILADLGKLDDDQLKALLDGTAKFKYYAPGEKPQPTKRSAGGGSKKPALDEAKMAEWKDRLFACKTKDEAVEFVNGLKVDGRKLTADQLKKWADFLPVVLLGRNKAEKVLSLVEGTVMAKLRSAVYDRI
ncbi:MAG: hypothetical protein IJR14_07715 [Synergistaceae bacterium]|nr:hypothetical protein [Synergistaceae bacterium]